MSARPRGLLPIVLFLLPACTQDSADVATIILGTVDPAFSVYDGENKFEVRRDDHFDVMIMP